MLDGLGGLARVVEVIAAHVGNVAAQDGEIRGLAQEAFAAVDDLAHGGDRATPFGLQRVQQAGPDRVARLVVREAALGDPPGGVGRRVGLGDVDEVGVDDREIRLALERGLQILLGLGHVLGHALELLRARLVGESRTPRQPAQLLVVAGAREIGAVGVRRRRDPPPELALEPRLAAPGGPVGEIHGLVVGLAGVVAALVARELVLGLVELAVEDVLLHRDEREAVRPRGRGEQEHGPDECGNRAGEALAAGGCRIGPGSRAGHRILPDFGSARRL